MTTALAFTFVLTCSTLHLGCDKVASAPAAVHAGEKTMQVKIAGENFNLDVAADNPTRTKGLGSRTDIPERGGMIFAFPASRVDRMSFVMRDCPIDIDIAYLDGVGRVLTTYTMKAEPPRGANGTYEGEPGDWDINAITDVNRAKAAYAYENRLKQYPSRYPTSFVIELRAGTIDKLKLKEGDVVEFDHAGLKKLAK
jgi:uncharacterized membrane protein (UPF0127 family)